MSVIGKLHIKLAAVDVNLQTSVRKYDRIQLKDSSILANYVDDNNDNLTNWKYVRAYFTECSCTPHRTYAMQT